LRLDGIFTDLNSLAEWAERYTSRDVYLSLYFFGYLLSAGGPSTVIYFFDLAGRFLGKICS